MMSVTFYDMTDCYKCGDSTMALRGAVHPLCPKCDTDFQAWFETELDKIEARW